MGGRIASISLIVLVAGCGYPEFSFVPDAVIDAAPVEVAADAIDDVPEVAARDATLLRTWNFDFGSIGQQTTGYTNVHESHAGGGALAGLVDDQGVASTVAIRIDDVECFHTGGSNGAGTTTPPDSLGIPATATRDSLYGSTMTWMGQVHPRTALELSGLDPAVTYDLTFYASRLAGSGVLETAYAVRGAGAEQTAYLDANDNVSTVASVRDVRPTASGTVAISLTAGPKNTSTYGFFYLGAMKLSAMLR